MPNYKSGYSAFWSVEMGGVKVVLGAGMKLIKLIAVGGATLETLHDWRDNSNYQVPSGKKATVIHVDPEAGFNAVNDGLTYSDNLDGNTNEVQLLDAAVGILNPTGFISEEVPALKYINKKSTTSTDQILVYVIEEDA